MLALPWVDMDMNSLQVLDNNRMYLDNSDNNERGHLEVEDGDLSRSELNEDKIPKNSLLLGDKQASPRQSLQCKLWIWSMICQEKCAPKVTNMMLRDRGWSQPSSTFFCEP